MIGEWDGFDADKEKSSNEKNSLGLDFGKGLRDSGDLGLGSNDFFESKFRVTLADEKYKSGRKLGDPEYVSGGKLGEQIVGKWDYRTLPNKMLELVKNLGNMKQEGTGYFADSESEMLTVLAYLNYGETTGTTDSMREQIDEAVKQAENRELSERDDADRYTE